MARYIRFLTHQITLKDWTFVRYELLIPKQGRILATNSGYAYMPPSSRHMMFCSTHGKIRCHAASISNFLTLTTHHSFSSIMFGTFLSPSTNRMGGTCTRVVATSVAALSSSSSSSSSQSSGFYALSAFRGDGSVQKMADFQGKIIYATNVASM